MTIQVNRELCSGCGNCLSVCPSNAIRLEGGRAVIEGTLCIGCEACMESCPQGAIVATEVPKAAVQQTSSDAPALTAQPLSIQPVEQSRGIVAEPLPFEKKSWLNAVLAFAAREVFPRFVDTLVDSLERRQKAPPPLQSQVKSLPSLVAQKSLRAPHHLRRGGYGHRQRRQVRGREAGKGKWV